ncbi:uncharacterized protein BDV17DRAFT_76996 [Aspergillus undulatus]|uniref:uncharacterized protein n=1 Tax=Aspergillus undulatus TaxID=1810928 RepID=UPI003CCD00CA
MAEASMPCDVSGWAFDPMNPGPGFSLEPGVAGDEELWYRNQFGMNSFDLSQWQPMDANRPGYELASPAMGKTPYQQLSPKSTGAFSSRSEKMLPRFENLQTDNSAPYSLDDLLRTASQLATERALYMNIPPVNPLSPAAEPGISSPSATSHHSNASDTDEHDVSAFEVPQIYQLPGDNASGNNTNTWPIHQLASRDHVATTTASATAKENSLTPLEMPDGTTRFTANWLPVDPQGGFTIRPPAYPYHSTELDPELMDYQAPYVDPQGYGHNNYNYRNAFISLEDLDTNAGNQAGM